MSGHIVPIRDAFSQRREHSLIFLGCLFAVLLMGASAWFMMRTGDKNGSSTATDEKARAVDPAIAAVDNRTSRISQAAATMDSFLKTVTVEEKVPFVRGGAALLPVMREYYATHSDEPSGALSAENNGYFEYDGMEFFLMGMNLKDGRRVETAVEWTAAGPKLDWRFLTGNGDMEWTAWIESHPARPVNLRVLAVLDDYYAPPFADTRAWICLKITDLARTAPVWAYIARESDEGKQVAQKLEGRKKNCRLMGAFAFPDPLPPSHSRTPQVRILSVAPRGWLDDSPEVTGNVPAKTPDGQGTSSP